MTGRLFARAILMALVLLTAVCGGRELDVTQREDAYRANNRGVARLEQFEYERAATAFREALALDDTLAVARVNLGLALFYARDLEGATHEVTAAARLLPSALQPPYLLGLIARAENRDDDAIRAFLHVQQNDPYDVGTNVNLGQIYISTRNYPAAIEVLRRAFADEPYNVTAAYNLGLALIRIGQMSEGQQMLEQAQALRSTDYAVTVGTGYLEEGRYAEAIAFSGMEPELINSVPPTTAFTPVAVEAVALRTGDPTSPFGRRYSLDALTEDGVRALAAALGGGITLIDFDTDGDLDLFLASADGQQLVRNDGPEMWTVVTGASGLGNPPSDAVPIGAITADYDNDRAPDLFVLRYGGSSLYRNDGSGGFIDVTTTVGLPAYPFLPGAAAFVDVDHDGDVDLLIAGLADITETRLRAAGGGLVFPREFSPAPLQLLRNNQNGTFTDITRDAGIEGASHAIAVVPTDFDNRRDVDLLIVNRDGPSRLLANLRDGTFIDVAAEVGLAVAGSLDDEVTAVAAADINKDDFPDIFFAREKDGVFAMSDSRGRFTLVQAPDTTRAAIAAQFIDYDNDGLLDLLTWSVAGPRLLRNLGQEWTDVTNNAVPGVGASVPTVSSSHAVAAADLDADGDTDVVVAGSGPLSILQNAGDTRNRSIRVQLSGLASNRLGVGSKIQLRAGSLSARLETSAATPAVAPADLVFGLGQRLGADVVRVVWPSGILQAELAEVVGPAGAPEPPLSFLPSTLAIRELDRKPSSCPFLYTWNGERFEFVTDFLVGGVMGYLLAPGLHMRSDPVEYVRIRGDQLQSKDGRLDIRVTNELEETFFVDRLELVAIAHPRGFKVFPNEGWTDPPKPFQLYGVRDTRVPARATDHHGHDVTERIAKIDRRYADDFETRAFRGHVSTHALTLDLGQTSGQTLLLLTGWTDYAPSSDNVAAHQAGLTQFPPLLEIKDEHGNWRVAAVDVGFPVGRPQTIVVDLTEHLRSGEHELRLVTNMEIYWDEILVARGATTNDVRINRLDPLAARLRARGFSAEVRPGGTGPLSYDYARVTSVSPWKTMTGRYTREGDVRELLTRADDMFVIARDGDEIAVEFDATALEALPDGWTRTFLLRADGFSKEMDINSASPDMVEPLPFHRMTGYPYDAPEHYPDTFEYRRYRETYNTRAVVRSLPPLELAK